MADVASRRELVPLEGVPGGMRRQGREEPADLLDFRALWAAVRQRSRVATAIIAASLLAASVYLIVVPPKYTATSIIHVDPRQQHVLSSQQVLPGIGADAAAVESQVELIRSTAAALQVIKELKLLDDAEFAEPSLLERLLAIVSPRNNEGDPEKAETVHRNKVIARFREQLDVRRRGLTYILEVGFESIDPDKAARIANAVADVYLKDQLAIKSDATTTASKWLTERIEALRNQVAASERAVAEFKAVNNIVDVGAADSGLTLNNRQIEQLNQQLILARARAAEAKAKYDQVKRISDSGVDPGSLPDALRSEVISRLREQYAAVARVEAEYSSTYGAGHPNLGRVRSQLARMHDQIKREVSRIMTGARNEYEIATSRVRSLAASLKELEAESTKLNRARVSLAALEREAQANRALFEQFLTRAKETTEQRSLQRADARIVAYAIRPVEPSSPKKLIVLLVALVGGGGLAFGSVILGQSMDRSYRSRAELESDMGIPCLGVCPAIDPDTLGNDAVGGLSRWISRCARLSRVRRSTDDWDFRQLISQLGVDQPGSSYADAIRAVRLGCTALGPNTFPKVILVSSALPGEGKSTIAANLARSLARTGAFTLLMDADIRAGALSDLLAGSGAPGLSEVLNGTQTFDAAAICEPASGMYFLPAGQVRMNADDSDLVVDDRLVRFLRHYRSVYNYIVIDGPPILTMADGRYLFHHADAALFVVEWGATECDAVYSALSALGSMRGKIIGSVLNKARSAPHSDDVYEYAQLAGA